MKVRLLEKSIFNFFFMFLNPNIFSIFNSNWSNLWHIRNLQEQVKNHSVTKKCSELSLFEQIVLVISKFFQILGLTTSNFKHFSRSLEQIFLTEGQNQKYSIWSKQFWKKYHFPWILLRNVNKCLFLLVAHTVSCPTW